jgi:dTDP-4-dehydrorhamnose 3,5-epimerase
MSLSIFADPEGRSVDGWVLNSAKTTINKLWIPPGFAHGFLVLSEIADVLYKTTNYYAPEHERCLIWNDAKIAIEWPLDREPVLSAKDRLGVSLGKAEVFA